MGFSVHSVVVVAVAVWQSGQRVNLVEATTGDSVRRGLPATSMTSAVSIGHTDRQTDKQRGRQADRQTILRT